MSVCRICTQCGGEMYLMYKGQHDNTNFFEYICPKCSQQNDKKLNRVLLRKMTDCASQKFGYKRFKEICRQMIDAANKGENNCNFYVTKEEEPYISSKIVEMELFGREFERADGTGYDIEVYW